MQGKELFNLIDAAYSEDLSNQPQAYKKCLLHSARALLDDGDQLQVCLTIYKSYHDNFMVPMSFPPKNRKLYQYIMTRLKKLDQKQKRDLNLGYGLVATHFTFGPLN
uniref:Bacteriocin immunity protein n=1 Tax=Loigolactobacillus rennini TaxID=238013 RepID=A0A1K2I5G3_9LACO|nr:unknown [Loigolactobacillus rennini]